MERSSRRKKRESIPESVPVEITTVQGLLALRGQVVKYTMDSGSTWYYGKLWDSDRLVTFAFTSVSSSQTDDVGTGTDVGMPIDEEVVVVDGKEVHMRSAICRGDLVKPGFIVRTTNTKEIVGKRFSYDNLR